MEPVSGMYTNGLAVLDFKSLYPSVMIARDPLGLGISPASTDM